MAEQESLELYSKVNPRIVEEHFNTLHTVLVSINWFVNTHTNANNYDINIIIMMDNCKVLLNTLLTNWHVLFL